MQNTGRPFLFSLTLITRLSKIEIKGTSEIKPKDELLIDPVKGELKNLTTKIHINVSPIPEHLMDMISSGGLMPFLRKKIDDGEIKVRKE